MKILKFKKQNIYLLFLCIFASIELLSLAFYPYIISYLVDNANLLNKDSALFVILSFIGSVFLILLFGYFKKRTINVMKLKFTNNLRAKLFNCIISKDYNDFYSQNYDFYSSFIINDIEKLYVSYFENYLYGIIRILSLAIFIGVLSFMNWVMGILVFLTIILCLFVPMIVGKRFDTFQDNYSKSIAKYTNDMNDLFSAYEYIKTNKGNKIFNKYYRSLNDFEQSELKLNNYRSFIQIFSGGTLYLQLVLVLMFGLIFSVLQINNITISEVISSLVFTDLISSQLADFVEICLGIKSSRVYKEKVTNELINNVSERITIPKCSCIEMKDLKIGYKNFILNVDNQVLDLNKKYLLIGKNGSGKSSLLKVIAGINFPISGKVNYNHGSNDVEISYISQKRHLFNLPVEENLLLFSDKDSLTQSDLEMIKKLKLDSKLKEIINRQANTLSGGEIAKICFLREIIKNKKSFLILDEPFNDIDDQSRKQIFDFLKTYEKGFILVTHELSSIEESIFDFKLKILNGKIEKI